MPGGLPLDLEICGNFNSCNMKIKPVDFMYLFSKHCKDSLLEKSDVYEESLQPTFKAILYSFNEKDQKALCKLSVFPCTFESQTASKISEKNVDTLQILSKSGLIKNDLLSKRYIIHRWIKEQLKD